MGKKYQILKENIFDQIAKMIALSQLKREIPKAIKLIEEDPITVSTLENLQYHAQKLSDILKSTDFCKRNPKSNLCKKK